MRRLARAAAKGLLVLVAIGLGAELGVAWRLRGLSLLPLRQSPGLAAALHVHTTRSDGRAPINLVARKASAAGLKVLGVSDHNKTPLPAQRMEGVLILPGVELSTSMGHLLAWGGDRLPSLETRSLHPFEAGQEAGSFQVLAHPINRRRPWDGPFTGVGGMEVVSGDSAYREALVHPLRLLTALLLWPLNHDVALLHLMVPPEAALARWHQALAAGEAMQGLCGHDAHGLPNYETAFRVLRSEWPDGPASIGSSSSSAPDKLGTAEEHPARLAKQFIEALRSGDTRCTLPMLGDASRLKFGVVGDRVEASLSPRLEGQPSDRADRAIEATEERAELQLFRDGHRVASDPQRVSVPLQAGRYHVEVYLDRPWVFGRRRFLWILGGVRSWPVAKSVAPSP